MDVLCSTAVNSLILLLFFRFGTMERIRRLYFRNVTPTS